MKRNSMIPITKTDLNEIYNTPIKTKKKIIESPEKKNKKKKEDNKIKNLKGSSISPSINKRIKSASPFKVHQKRQSIILSDINQNPRFNLLKQFEDKEKDAQIQLLIKRRNLEIQNLVKERRKLRKILVMTRETYELRILSSKILQINMKINRLLKLNDALLIYPEEYENQIIKPKLKKHKSYDLNDIDFSSMKGDLKKINNYLKLNKIKHDGRIIDIATVIESIVDKPSYFFQREKENKLFTPSTEFCGEKRKLGKTTMYLKSFNPNGFTSRNKNRNNDDGIYSNTFEDLFYEIEDKNKKKDFKIINTINSSSNYKTMDSDSNKSNTFRLSSVRPTTCESISNNKSNFYKFSHTLKKKKNNSISIKNHTQNIKDNIFKLLNDTRVIKEAINNTIREENKEIKKDSERVLLKLAEKLLKKKKKRILEPKKLTTEGETLEEQYIDKLETIPNTVKGEFRDCFKTILFQDRILNKPDPNNENPYDEKLKILKEQKKIQRETIHTMYILKENIFTGKEDEQVFKDEMVFDNYGNMSSLEWLIKKHHILDNTTKFIGAYNPKEKLNLCIHYPDEV